MTLRAHLGQKIFDAIDAVARFFPPRVARSAPVKIFLVVHTESIADAEIFARFHDFLKKFSAKTGGRAIACVMTPHCPLVARAMAAKHCPEEDFVARLRELGDIATIGFHGHFVKPGQNSSSIPAPFSKDFDPIRLTNFDEKIIETQARDELDWLATQGFPARDYTAGWWVMDARLARILAKLGTRRDFSIRRGHRNTFGEAAIPDEDLPARGIVAPLFGTEIESVQSIFLPIPTPIFTARKSMKKILETVPGREIQVAIAIHDYDLTAKNKARLWKMIDFLGRIPGIVWARD